MFSDMRFTAGRFLLLAGALGGLLPILAPAQSPAPTLDYEFFKTKVQPIFIAQRSPAHARCYACHEASSHDGLFKLATLSPGATNWNEAQTRENFEMASRIVAPGNPMASVLLVHPLAPEKGGDADRLHSGGRQFASQDDPDWKIMEEWVMGKKAGGGSH
ncbi:MAG TPA: hypothetical protein VHW09_08000 [Bryobacteraceae bacterium]|jgi:hypothetical protein|nr:hypothetical protein [Bryobacteraceae bacterium]